MQKSLSYTVRISSRVLHFSLGGARRKLIEPLFTLQKRSVRFIFGAQADFLEKFNTAARVRPFGQQKLGKDFYQKKNTKPLFVKFNLLTVYDFYK